MKVTGSVRPKRVLFLIFWFIAMGPFLCNISWKRVHFETGIRSKGFDIFGEFVANGF